MLLISCIWLHCHAVLRLDMLCVNASCLLSISDMWIMQCHVFTQLSYMWIMHRHGARHHICELSHAIFFSITYSICRQSVYIELLFMCISHLSRLWKNLEWNKVFREGNGTCWSIYLDGYMELLRGGFRERWPVLCPTWGVCSKLQYFIFLIWCIWCLALLSLDIICRILNSICLV